MAVKAAMNAGRLPDVTTNPMIDTPELDPPPSSLGCDRRLVNDDIMT
jgi:hypothetical protein